jgi:hypothetical protein
MSSPLSHENIIRLLRFAAEMNLREDLFWGEDLTFSVNVSDVFHWGCSSFEEITDDTLDDFIGDVEEVEAAVKRGGWEYGLVLYAARRRGMRPQGAWFKADANDEVRQNIYPLIRECGPARELGLANPQAEVTAEDAGSGPI